MTLQDVNKMVDQKCSIDESAFYADIRRFEELGIEPEVCPCDYCKSPGNCPHNGM